MRVVALLNRDGGTLKTIDLDDYAAHLQREFAAAGHEFEHRIVPGAEIVSALETAAGEKNIDALLAGGGDGTVSAAAAIAWKAGKPLGVLPAGTMNLFARSLGVPLDLYEAATGLARGRVTLCDIATADGRPFVHQFSVGLQPRIVRERERAARYTNRVGKIAASLVSALAAMANPPRFLARLQFEGKEIEERLSVLTVSNNPYGEGHLPFADRLDRGILGIYRAPVLDFGGNLSLAAGLMMGDFRTNPDLTEDRATEIEITFPRLKRSAQATIDGELVKLQERVRIEIRPGALKVLRPEPQDTTPQ